MLNWIWFDMVKTIEFLLKSKVDNTINLNDLYKTNKPAYRLLTRNYKVIAPTLVKMGIDIIPYSESDTLELPEIISFVKFYYGTTVRLSQFRDEYTRVYLCLCRIGRPFTVLTQLGFSCTLPPPLISKLKEPLSKYADATGMIPPLFTLDRKLYNKLYNTAVRNNMTVDGVLGELGYTRDLDPKIYTRKDALKNGKSRKSSKHKR